MACGRVTILNLQYMPMRKYFMSHYTLYILQYMYIEHIQIKNFKFDYFVLLVMHLQLPSFILKIIYKNFT